MQGTYGNKSISRTVERTPAMTAKMIRTENEPSIKMQATPPKGEVYVNVGSAPFRVYRKEDLHHRNGEYFLPVRGGQKVPEPFRTYVPWMELNEHSRALHATHTMIYVIKKGDEVTDQPIPGFDPQTSLIIYVDAPLVTYDDRVVGYAM